MTLPPRALEECDSWRKQSEALQDMVLEMERQLAEANAAASHSTPAGGGWQAAGPVALGEAELKEGVPEMCDVDDAASHNDEAQPDSLPHCPSSHCPSDLQIHYPL